MKIKPEHFAHMRAAIGEVIARVPAATYRAEIVAEGKARDVEKRIRWDYAYAAKLTPWLCANVYPYADDSHIDTALRAIMREVESAS